MWSYRINKGSTAQFIRIRTAALKTGFIALLLSMLCAAAAGAKGKIDEDLAKEYFEIAQAYTETAKYDKAVSFYLKAAKDPAHKNAAEYNLARVYGLQGDWQRARPILERQYQEAPGNMLILKAFAYSLAATGDEVRACEMYKNLYESDLENPESALNYARMLIFAKKYEEATALITELKTRFTENAEKKVLDELEEKIRKALAPPEEKDEDVKDSKDAAKKTADKEHTKEKTTDQSKPQAQKKEDVQAAPGKPAEKAKETTANQNKAQEQKKDNRGN